MSTIKELSESKVTITMKPKEGFLLSFFRDLFTFVFIGFAVYISKDSTWWTFVTGSMFIFFAWVKICNALKNNAKTFQSTEDAIKYLNKLEL